MNAVLAEDGSAACGHPDSSQCVAVNLVLLNHPLAFLVLKHKAESAIKNPINNLSREGCYDLLMEWTVIYHIDAPVLSIVDLVVPYNGATVGSDLDSRQGITVDIVTLYQTPPVPEYVHPSLVTVEYSVSPA